MKRCKTLEISWMPAAPARKQAINVQAAAFGEKPPLMSEDFDDGSILYNEEKSYSWLTGQSGKKMQREIYHYAEAQAQ